MDMLAVAIFAVALIGIAIDFTHRTKLALVGAGLVVLLGVIDQEQAIDSVDWATLGLLTGMMIIVGSRSRLASSPTSRSRRRESRGDGRSGC